MSAAEDPVAILKNRLARGEIDTETYASLLALLVDAPEPGGPPPSASPAAASPSPSTSAPPPAGSPPASALPSPPSQTPPTEAGDAFPPFAARLRDLGYMVEPGGRVLARDDDRGEWVVIGDGNGWLRVGTLIGRVAAFYLVLAVLLGVTAFLTGGDLESWAERAPALFGILSWLPLLAAGVLLWDDRQKWHAFLAAQQRAHRETAA